MSRRLVKRSRDLHVNHATGIYIYQIDHFNIVSNPRLQHASGTAFVYLLLIPGLMLAWPSSGGHRLGGYDRSCLSTDPAIYSVQMGRAPLTEHERAGIQESWGIKCNHTDTSPVEDFCGQPEFTGGSGPRGCGTEKIKSTIN